MTTTQLIEFAKFLKEQTETIIVGNEMFISYKNVTYTYIGMFNHWLDVVQKPMRTSAPMVYDHNNIQTVYHRHHYHCGTVLYSTDGYVWQSVPMDTGKWDIRNWKFSFIEM